MADKTKVKESVYCDFCGKSRDEVKKMIVGNEVAICNECVDLCSNILNKEIEVELEKKAETGLSKYDPMLIANYLNEHVIGQEDAKMSISVAVANHYKRIFRPSRDVTIDKSNILMVGPTGSGKTLIAKTIAEYLDVPFTIADATTLTESGYVGDDVESIVSRLLQVCDFDVEKAEQGIIFLDEIDKISRKSENTSITRDVSGEGVQQALLKVIEGSKLRVPPTGGRKHPNAEFIEVDTTNILFICGGAFVGIDQMAKNRVKGSSIGFISNKTETSEDKSFEPDDFVKFGLIPELIGRFGHITYCEELTEENIIDIITKTKNNIIKQYQYLFSLDKVKLEITTAGVAAIAKKSVQMKTGARSVRTILEKLLVPYQYDITNSVKNGLEKLVIDKATDDATIEAKLIYKQAKKTNGVS